MTEPPSDSPELLRDVALRGVRWTIGSRIATFAYQFAVSAVVARILVPEDFGLMGMVSTATALASVLVDAGLGAAVVQEPDLRQSHLDAAFAASVFVGAVAFIILVSAAPWVAMFYGEPRVERLTRLSAFAFVFVGVGIVPRAVLQRSMAIRRLSILDFVVSLSGGLVAVVLAVTGAGVWALAWSTLYGSALSALLPLFFCGWRPRRLHDIRDAGTILRVAWNLLGSNIVGYVGRNTDGILIGRRMGETALGLYARAYSLMGLPVTLVVSTLSTSMLPAMVAVRHDRARSGRIYIRSIGLIALVAFPAMLGLSAAAGPFILTIFGPGWAGSIPIVRWLAVVGAFQAIAHPSGWVYLSQGRTDLMLKWSVSATGVAATFMAGGAYLGSPLTVAIAYAVAAAVLFVPGLLLPLRLLGLSLKDGLGVILPPAITALVMLFIVRLIDALLDGQMDNLSLLLLEATVGATFYAAICLRWKFSAVLDLREMVLAGIASRRNRKG